MTSETEETVLDLEALRRWFDQIPAGPFDALHTTTGWEVRQLDTDPTNKHHWPFRLCSSVAGQTAGCDEAVFSFIAGVINAWPAIDAALSRAPEAEELGASTRMTSPASRSLTPLSAGWKDIASAPMDGTVFQGCNLDHPSFGSWAMCRRVRHSWDDQGEPVTQDLGGWVIISDVEHDYHEAATNGPEPSFSVAPDDLNQSVRYGWCPLNQTEDAPSGAQRSELTRPAQDEPVSSPPSTGGEGEALIMRVGERIADEVEKVAGGRQSNCEQAARDIVGWLHPSPEMGGISREELVEIIDRACLHFDDPTFPRFGAPQAADLILSKLKENGLSREELGGLAQSLPSGDAQERSPVPPLSDGGRV